MSNKLTTYFLGYGENGTLKYFNYKHLIKQNYNIDHNYW